MATKKKFVPPIPISPDPLDQLNYAIDGTLPVIPPITTPLPLSGSGATTVSNDLLYRIKPGLPGATREDVMNVLPQSIGTPVYTPPPSAPIQTAAAQGNVYAPPVQYTPPTYTPPAPMQAQRIPAPPYLSQGEIPAPAYPPTPIPAPPSAGAPVTAPPVQTGALSPFMYNFPQGPPPPVVIQPHEPSALERQYSDMLQNMPSMHPPTKLQRILNAIQAGAAGWQGGAAEGAKLAHQLTVMPYDTAMKAWQARIAGIKPLMEMEQANWERAYKEQDLASKMRTAEITGDTRVMNALSAQQRALTGAQEAESKDRHRRVQEKYTLWRIDHPKETDFQFLMSLGPEDQAAGIEVLHQMHPMQTPEGKAAAAAAVTGARIDKQMEKLPEIKKIEAVKTTSRTQASTDVKLDPETIKKEAEKAKEVASAREEGKAESPANVEAAENIAKMFREGDPQNAHDLLSKASPGVRTAFDRYNIDSVQERKLSQPERRRDVAAAQTLYHVARMRESLQDPDVRNRIQSLIGRYTLNPSLKAAIGLSKQQAKFLTAMHYLTSNEASMMSGTGSAPKFTLDFFKNVTANTRFTPDLWEAALDVTEGHAKAFRQMVRGNYEAIKDTGEKKDEYKIIDGLKVKILKR